MADQAEGNIFDKHASEGAPSTPDEGESQKPESHDAAPATKSLPEGLEEWVGEGRKYRDVETALSSIPHAQEHISSLETQLEEYKRKVEEAKTVDDLLEKINSGTGQKPETPSGEAPTTDDVMSLVNQAIEKREATQTAEQNAKQVISALSAQYGDKAKEQYQKRAGELGMTTQDLDNLCLRAPKAALSLLGASGGTESEVSASQGGIRSEGLAQVEKPQERRSVMSAGDTKTVQNEWQRIKKEVSKKYGE